METIPTARHFTAEEWGGLGDVIPMPLSEPELHDLMGRGESTSLFEASQIYWPLAQLLQASVLAGNFTGPYIIGLAGSVAVGKSTTARILRSLLARWPSDRDVALVPTDGFLLPNRILEERDLMARKGFPESYDIKSLLEFMRDVKSGVELVKAPIYSHHAYDVVPNAYTEIGRPAILILEGLNVLQSAEAKKSGDSRTFVSDFFDFSIYLDAAETDLRRWYIERFLDLRTTAFQDPTAHFHRYAGLSEAEAIETAGRIWATTNLANLRQNIYPTRARARLILRKSSTHAIDRVWLRKP